jgi:hypothetical protein
LSHSTTYRPATTATAPNKLKRKKKNASLFTLCTLSLVLNFNPPGACLDGGVNGVNGANLPLIYP